MNCLPYRPEKAEALDIDSENQFNLLRIYFGICSCFNGVYVRRSPSGSGYHVYTREGFNISQAETFGDCQGRLKYWEIQGYSFTFKKKGKGVEEEMNMLSLPFWSRLPARKWKR